MLNPLSRQILADLTTASREARKQNLSICLYSQQLGDFPQVLVELATSIYVLGTGTARETDEIARRFGFNEAARYALRNITRPTSAGADLVALFRTSLGTSIQHLTCTAGSFAKWAFTTTAEDMRVRNRLYETLGLSRALECLTRYYPHALLSGRQHKGGSRAQASCHGEYGERARGRGGAHRKGFGGKGQGGRKDDK